MDMAFMKSLLDQPYTIALMNPCNGRVKDCKELIHGNRIIIAVDGVIIMNILEHK